VDRTGRPTTGLPGVNPADVTFNIYAIAEIPGTTSVWATGDGAPGGLKISSRGRQYR
jgi:hypothetical protein